MRPPSFWDMPQANWLAQLLRPLGALYAYATARRLARGTPLKLDIPVICIGNINAGGTGKTPSVIAVLEHLRGHFHEPHVVTRGYGGRLNGPVRVDPARHSARDVGDEPLLLSAFAEVWVAKDRAAGAQAAQVAGATAIVLDDGFQNPALHYDLAVVVVDAAKGFGNGLCLPAGPLREPVEVGLERADLILSIGDDEAQSRFAETAQRSAKPHTTAALAPLQTGMGWSGERVLAFAGIGQPQKFFDTLRQLGAILVHTEALEDHQPLSTGLMKRLAKDARAQGAQLVTTEKDAVRLPSAFRSQVITLPVRLSLPEQNALFAALETLPPAK